ncbi:MAG: thioesterase family protein [Haloarculaceae archaeon]
MDLPQIWENRVRFEETDRQGIVFYGNYVTFQDETVTQFFRETGFDYTQRHQEWDVHVVNVDLNYHGQADVGDELVHGVRVDAFGTSSMTFEYAARRVDDGSLVVEGSVTHVAVDGETGEPTPIPEDFRESVREFQDEPPTERDS